MRSASCTLTIVALILGATIDAYAACPSELAVYRDIRGLSSIEFRPTGEGASVTNTFRLLLEKDVVFDGIVMWSEGEPRPFGQLTYKCPEGDVTGAEIELCTVWQGVIYGVADEGAVELMPGEGVPAPQTLIFAGLGLAVRTAPAFQAAALTVVPWDVFQLSGCQE